MIYNIQNNLPVPIYGKGINSREWIHVEDHCVALDVLSLRGKIGENYNIGSGKNLSNLNLVKFIVKIMKEKYKIKARIIFVEDRPGHDLRYALDSRKIYKEFNWKAKINLMEGLSKTIDWYMNNQNFFKSLSKNEHVKRIGLKI